MNESEVHNQGDYERVDETVYRFELTRRGFVQLLGAGILITATGGVAFGQRFRGRGGPQIVGARLHLGADGVVTVMTGKVEIGQGARTEITQAAAEELRVPVARVNLLMADTDVTPDDGGTYGSRTTPATIPPVRRAAAYGRELLLGLAAARLKVPRESLEARDGVIAHGASGKSVSYADLAKDTQWEDLLKQEVPADVEVTAVAAWTVLGTPVPRITGEHLVTGAHRYPSDFVRPGMLHGKVLRPPAFGASLKSIDLAPARNMKDVRVVRDGDFVGCAAPTSWLAGQAVKALAAAAQWESAPAQPSSRDLFAYLRTHARPEGGGDAPVAAALGKAAQTVSASYEVAYIQHVPLEPRAAVAEWDGGRVTVWTGTQDPGRVHGQVAEAFSLPGDKVRVVVPDTGGGFGGKHTGETAIEAARLAQAAGKPVSVRWDRTEEFTWAYFRPAGVIDLKAGLDDKGHVTAWEHVNINSGGAGIGCPYAIAVKSTRQVPCDAPLREGSYRALAATANNFAREVFMDELAAKAGMDPLAFRLAHLEDERLRNVLEAAVKNFGGFPKTTKGKPDTGVGLACGTEKGSFVAACVEVRVDRAAGTIRVLRVSEAFECGAVLNPSNLEAQIQGCIIMGLGGALMEAVEFADGKILNATLGKYRVPRFKDVPPIDLVVLNRPDLPSVGAGETPLIAIAPAIANAAFAATGIRVRSLPMRGDALRG